MNNIAKAVVAMALAVTLAANSDVAWADRVSGAAATTRGQVTNLPLPRFVSLKAQKANVRRGPSLSHRVDWVYTKEGMPLEITAEFGNWRRVRDSEGEGGWVHYSLLSGVRTVMVEKDYAQLREKPRIGARPNAYAEQGVIASLGECRPNWCRIRSGGYEGWVLRAEIWGVGAEEFQKKPKKK